MTERHHYKYLYIDSKHRNPNNSKANFEVNFPSPLQNVTRVCVKSFSIPNTFGNVIGDLSKVKWIEFLYSGGVWNYEVFSMDISNLVANTNYVDNATLATHLGTQFGNPTQITKESNNSASHVFNTEPAMSITCAYNATTFKFSFTVSQNTVHKIFAPYIEPNTNSLWENIGYDRSKILNYQKVSAFLQYLNSTHNSSPNAVHINEDANVIRYYAKDAFIGDASNVINFRTIQGDFPSVHENHIKSLSICSNALTSDSFVMNNNVVVNTNILDRVVNDVPKYSYLHKEINLPFWNKLSKGTIKSFDIQILDHNNIEIENEAMPDYTLCLLFEIQDEIEYHKEFIEAYNLEGYRLGHPF